MEEKRPSLGVAKRRTGFGEKVAATRGKEEPLVRRRSAFMKW
jgi:hypothetical protein